MAYLSLYRKYRSSSFEEVIGQPHVTTVLRNALRQGRLGHAYLFCGPRGCGKTSTARLVARALNCEAASEPTPDPCGECDMCRAIMAGTAIDVVEMDAASETGIDDVREKVIENAKFAPAIGRYKVFIIDEVHDLSAKAFDSLLKTIEEPPAHVVFVLATTEVHKVPVTIRSRCQRMDFRRGSHGDLIRNLERVLQAEGIAYEPDALPAIAAAAEGSYRDSLSLLEQVLAYGEGKVEASAVHEAVGSVGNQTLDEIVRTLVDDDPRGALELAGKIAESGKDIRQLLGALQTQVRDLLVAGISGGGVPFGEIPAERIEELRKLGTSLSQPQLLAMLDALSAAERDARFTNQHRLLLERTLWKLLPSSLQAGAPVAAQPPPAPSHAAASRPANLRPTRQAAQDTVEPELPPPLEERQATDAAPLDLASARRLWPRIRQRLLREFPAAKAILTDAVSVSAAEGSKVTLDFPNDFMKQKAEGPRAKEKIEGAFAVEARLERVRVLCRVAASDPDHEADEPSQMRLENDSPPLEGVAPPAQHGGGEALEEEQALLQQVIEEFRGTIVSEGGTRSGA